MGKIPSYPMYAADFDMDTNTWTNEEVGVYIRLLNSEWVNGGLPDDPIKLSKIARISLKKFKNVFKNISHKFNKNGNGLLYNQRLERERENKLNWLKSQSKSGKKGAEKRWGKSKNEYGDPNGDPNGELMACAYEKEKEKENNTIQGYNIVYS